MKKVRFLVGVIVGVIFFTPCGCKKKEEKGILPPPAVTGEKLLWSTHKERPVWIQKPLKTDGEYCFFIGQSEKFAIEKGARDSAYRDAIKQAGISISTMAKDSFQKLLASHNVESQIIDKTVVSRDFEEQISKTLLKKARVREFYEEQRECKSGETYWVAFALLEVPVASIDEIYKNTAEQSKKELMQDLQTSKDEKAKEQLKSAMEAFDEASKQGFEPGE